MLELIGVVVAETVTPPSTGKIWCRSSMKSGFHHDQSRAQA